MLSYFATAVLLALIHTTVLGAKDICYKPDGAETHSTTYTPCLSSGNATHCCDRGQTCLQNGLCLAKTNTSLTTGLCTDSTWADNACFPYCLKPRRIHYISTVYRCSNDHWCCSDGANNTSCCEDEGVNKFRIPEDALVQNGSAFRDGYSIAPIKNIVSAGKTATPPPSLSTLTFTTDVNGSPITLTATTTSDPNNMPMSSSDDSRKATTAGLGAGLGVGIPLLGVIGMLSFLLFREKKRHRAAVKSMVAHGSYHENLPLYAASTSPIQKAPFPSGREHTNATKSSYAVPSESAMVDSMISTPRIEADSQEKSHPRPELPG